MIYSHIRYGHKKKFQYKIFRVDNKSMPGDGYERDLGLGCRLLGGSKQNCEC